MSFPESLRRELIRALRSHPLFDDIGRLREVIHNSLAHLPEGRMAGERMYLSSSASANALAVVAHTRELGRGSRNVLGRILERTLEFGLTEMQSLVFCAAFEALAYYGQHRCIPRPRWGSGTVPHPPRRFVAVSSVPEDEAQIAPMVEQLRSRGVVVERIADRPPPADWLLWITGRFSGADRIIVACSPIYRARYCSVLTSPFSIGTDLQEIAQEFRLMAYEYFVRGPSRFLPVLLEGADPYRHVPPMVRHHATCRIDGGATGIVEQLARKRSEIHHAPLLAPTKGVSSPRMESTESLR